MVLFGLSLVAVSCDDNGDTGTITTGGAPTGHSLTFDSFAKTWSVELSDGTLITGTYKYNPSFGQYDLYGTDSNGNPFTGTAKDNGGAGWSYTTSSAPAPGVSMTGSGYGASF